MKKIWNFILKYRIYIVIVLFLIFCGFVFVTMKAYLDPVDETTVYGTRLEGIEDVPITDKEIKEIEAFIKEDKTIESASISLKGKIVNISLKTNTKDNTIDKMKELSSKILEKFKKEEIDFYDFQFFINNNEGNYNMIGYKNKKNGSISWSSDEIQKSEVEVNEKEQ